MNTELRSDEADCGGVGVLGDVGTEADAGISGSVSAMLRKVILCGGSLSSGTGWPFRVPEVDVRTGRIPGDFRVYMVFLGCRGTEGGQEVTVAADDEEGLTCAQHFPKSVGLISRVRLVESPQETNLRHVRSRNI